MSGLDVAHAPHDTRPRRLAAKRRADAQPYEARRPRRSQRLGGAVGMDSDDDDDDDDVELNGARASRSVETTARPATGGGLFSRLFSFIPIVGKYVSDEAQQQNGKDADESMTRDKTNGVEAVYATSAVAMEPVVSVTTPASVQNGHAASPKTKPAARSPPSKRASPLSSRSPAKSRSPVATDKPRTNVLGSTAAENKSKALKIGNSSAVADTDAGFGRLTGRRRSKPSSPSRPAESSPIAVIKRKKPISFEEYERLSSQLRSLVETTPENAVALTRSALTPALEGRGASDAQENGRDRRELSVAALPSVKRARPSDDLPISLPREDHRSAMRKPKPSRLLTGAKRDAASRSAYSAAVAEKILTTLNKLQSPLDKESQKPTPSTSLSWAKYHLALTSQDERSGTREAAENTEMEDVEDLPPTSSIPKVAWKPVEHTQKPQATTPSTFAFSQPATITAAKPALPSSAAFSSASASVKAGVSPSSPLTKQQVGQFAFTLPLLNGAEGSHKRADDSDIQYFFTPPPALRDPPKRAPGQKASGSSTAPFSFMPASPKVRPESLTKSVPAKAKEPVVSAPAETKTSAASSSASGVNPLARFMQVAEGSWKCPSCAVTNGAAMSKCPCCETSKPADSAPKKTPAAPAGAPAASSVANPLARFMQVEPGTWKCPTCSVTNGDKFAKCPCCDTDKPGGAAQKKPSDAAAPSSGSISASGFTFGVASSEKKTETAPVSAGGFTFGAAPAEKAKAPVSSSTGFSFGVASSEKATAAAAPTSGFTFNAPAAMSTEAAKPSTGISFGAPPAPSQKPKRKASDESPSGGGEKKQATSAEKPSGGFTFGASAAATSTPAVTGFSFGASPKSAEETIEPAAKKTAFSFGSTEPVAPAQKPSLPSFLSGGAAAKPAAEKKTESTGFVVTFGSSAAMSEAKPSFSFGSTPSKPSFSFGAVNAEKTAAAKDSKPGFSFGGAASTASVFPPTVASDASSKPAFAFGVGASEPKSSGFSASSSGFGLTTSTPALSTAAPVKPASFSFGASSAAPVSSTASASTTTFGSASGAAPAFSFGASASDASAKKADTPGPAFSFGGAAAPAPATSFGGASTSFGADKPSSGSFGQSTAFGSGASVSTGFGSTSSGFSSTPTTSAGFGSSATTSSGFGSSMAVSSGFGAPMSSGFGATSSGFGSTMTSSGFGAAPTSTAFGATPASTPSFRTTPASTTPGAPAFSFGASTPASSQSPFGFGASSSSSAFSTPTTDVFGSASQPSTFGAPTAGAFGSSATSSGFGAAPMTTFGAAPTPSPAFGTGSNSGFGASTTFGAPSSGAFGVPTSALSPAFGAPPSGFTTPSNAFGAPSSGFNSAASSTFGSAPPTPSFGAPGASGFGAPTPTFGGAANSFGGAPAGDGFNVGAAPPKNRRILKAKTRSKRA